MRELFEIQKRVLQYFFDHMDPDQIEELLSLNFSRFITTGVGKSGVIAKKLSSTLVSVGAKAFFLDPLNALHGDMGSIEKGDMVLLFSKSGSTRELVDLVPHLKAKGAFLVSIVCQKNSRLEALCDKTIHLPLLMEICPHGLAPTTSCQIQLIFGDLFSVGWMKKRGTSYVDFATNHPGGLLGRKITHRVRDLMLRGKNLPTCSPEDMLVDMLHEFSSKRCGCLLVVDDSGVLQGIFTDGDLRRAIQGKGTKALHEKLSSLMTKGPKTVSENKMASEALGIMEANPEKLVSVLPVTQEGKLVGLLRLHDVIQSGL
jgi:arabinose-5-phosphate isomerase